MSNRYQVAVRLKVQHKRKPAPLSFRRIGGLYHWRAFGIGGSFYMTRQARRNRQSLCAAISLGFQAITLAALFVIASNPLTGAAMLAIGICASCGFLLAAHN